jgi:GAF domain-containing protein
MPSIAMPFSKCFLAFSFQPGNSKDSEIIMTVNATFLPGHSPVPTKIKQIAFVVLLITCAAGIANIFGRYDQLRYLATTYYHPYLTQVGLSDRFYIWYFLSSETLLALTFAVTGGIIALHRSTTWVTLFAAIALMLFGVTVPPPMHALVTLQGSIHPILCFVHAIGFALFVIFLYIFPDGRFVPRWTGILTIILMIWSVMWPFYPPLNPYRWTHAFPFLVLNFWFATGIGTQIYRYTYISSPVQQQQTKWVVFGLTAAVLGDFVTHIAWYIFPSLQKGSDWMLQIGHQPFFIASQLLAPLAIAMSILRFGLWEIDFIIHYTLVYSLLTAVLAAAWTATAKLLEVTLANVIGISAIPVAAGLAVLGISLIFDPLRTRLEVWVNHHFYAHKLNLSRDFVEFLPEARATIGFSELLQILIHRTLEILHILHGAIFLKDAHNQFHLAEVQHLPLKAAQSIDWNDQSLALLHKGEVTKQTGTSEFSLLVPLMLQRGEQSELIGVLALGPRQDGRQYSIDELWTFKTLANRAGTAIYIAQLNMENTLKLKQQINALEARVKSLETRLHSEVERSSGCHTEAG